MINNAIAASSGIAKIEALTGQEISLISGGMSGYRRADGSSFSWTGPNGIVYDEVVFVGTHMMEFADGRQEWYSDIFNTFSMRQEQIYMKSFTGYTWGGY